MAKYAIPTLERNDRGSVSTVYFDSETGERISLDQLGKYEILSAQDSSYDPKIFETEEGDSSSNKTDSETDKSSSSSEEKKLKENSGKDQSSKNSSSPLSNRDVAISDLFGLTDKNIGRSVGGTVGTLAGGPVGGLLGSAIGGAIGKSIGTSREESKVKDFASSLDPSTVSKASKDAYKDQTSLGKTVQDELAGMAGKTLGGTVGTLAGGPIGGAIGGALGKALGQKLSDEIDFSKKTDTPSFMSPSDPWSDAVSGTDPNASTNNSRSSTSRSKDAPLNEGYQPNFSPVDDPDLPARDMADLSIDLNGAQRSQVPSSGIQDKVQDIVTDVLGPDYSVSLFSGQEPEGTEAVGSDRHPAGYAGDFHITDPNGNLMSVKNNPDVFNDIAEGMAARYGANVGFGQEYMGGTGIHIDTKPTEEFSAGQAQQWASGAKSIADDLNNAREWGTMPASYYDAAQDVAPTIQNRPDMETMPSLADSLNNPQSYSYNNYRDSLFDDDTKDLMGRTLAGEIDFSKTDLTTTAGLQEAYGIMSTMENRAPKYDNSISNAITAANQYSTWNNAQAAQVANANYAANKDLIDSIVNQYAANPDYNLGYTNYYNASISNPEWAKDLNDVTEIGPHTFGSMGSFGTNFGEYAAAMNRSTPSTAENFDREYGFYGSSYDDPTDDDDSSSFDSADESSSDTSTDTSDTSTDSSSSGSGSDHESGNSSGGNGSDNSSSSSGGGFSDFSGSSSSSSSSSSESSSSSSSDRSFSNSGRSDNYSDSHGDW